MFISRESAASKTEVYGSAPVKPFTAEEARAWLAAIVDSADDAIIGKDLNGVVRSWNRSATRIFGYQPEEMIGTHVIRLIPPELRHEEQMILSKIRAGERVEHYDTERMRKDGSRVQVSLTVSPVRDCEGSIIGASKIVHDATFDRDARIASARLGAIVDSSDDAIIGKDLKGMVLSWNPAAERLYGYTAEEMIGTQILRLIPPELSREEDFILDKICSGERIEHYATQRVHKSGRRISVSITVSPIRDPSGKIVGASKIARDVTDELNAQRRKDEFLAVLAHELRNPLAPVRAAISLFGAPGVTEEQLAAAKRIADRQIAHMARLLDDLLDVTRITTGRVELKRARMDLCEGMDTAIDAVRSLIESKRHRLKIEKPDTAVYLDADAARINQIVSNLVTNAAKYTPDEGDIEVRCEKNGAEAIITVSDTGIGFSPEMGHRLFTLFAQDDRAVRRAAGGLGIGLALVKEFVERHGGTVRAHSAGHDKGSTFIVRLPCEHNAGLA